MEYFNTFSEAVDSLTKEGYREDFFAKTGYIESLYSKKKFRLEELKIVKSFRFEGMADPGDETGLFAIRANDGTKGTLVMSYNPHHLQNVELIKLIEEV